MTAPLQVIDPEMANALTVERVFINAGGELRARISNVECWLGTNEEVIRAGFVIFQPVDARLARQRPVFARLNVSGVADRFWCVATDPRLVNAAARFNVFKRGRNVVPEQQLWPGESCI